MGFASVLREAGLEVADEPADYTRTQALQGKSCFGHLLSNPNFYDAEDLRERAMESGEIIKRKLRWQDEDGGTYPVDGKVILRNRKTEENYAVVSDEYQVLQDKEVLLEAYEAVKALDLTPVGHVRQEHGRLHAAILIADPDYTIQPYDMDTDRYVATGFSLKNSYTGDLGVHAEAAGVDTYCANYMPWGDTLASVSTTHLDSGDLTDKIRGVLREALRNAPKAEAIMREAGETELRPSDVPYILAGVRFTPTQVEKIQNLAPRLEPAVKDGDVTQLDVANLATSFATNVARSTPRNQDRMSGRGHRILTTEPADLRDEGEARVEERWTEEERKAVPGVPA